MKKLKFHVITMVVATEKDVPHIAQHVTGRAYTLDGVDDVQLLSHHTYLQTEWEKMNEKTDKGV